MKIIKEELYRQNKDLRERLDTKNILQSKELDLRTEHEMEGAHRKIEEAKVEVRLTNPVCTMDSMIEALQCMKRMGVIATSIGTKFSEDESTSVITINAKVFSQFSNVTLKFMSKWSIYMYYPNY